MSLDGSTNSNLQANPSRLSKKVNWNEKSHSVPPIPSSQPSTADGKDNFNKNDELSDDELVGVKHPTPLAKKRSFSSLACVCFALLMGNIEYSVVMPSLWLYLKQLDPEVPELFFGVCLGAFNASQMLFSPLFGYWLDRRPMKEVIVFCLAVGIIGNSVYSLAPSIYVVLLGRIISGAGGNIYNTSMLYVIRVSDEDERSSLYAKVNLVYYLGMLSGPALNYPLSLLGHYRFGAFSVDPLNSPGYLMVLMLFVSVVLVMVYFQEPLNLEHADEELSPDEARCFGLAKYKPLFTSFTLLAIIIIQFIIQFNQITLETIVTPATHALYGFGQLANSIVYAAITVIFFIWFMVIAVIGKRVADRTFILIGVVANLAAFSFAVIWMYGVHKAASYRLEFWTFCVIVSAFVSGIPFFLSSLGSLFSKVVGDKRIQGMGQSMLASVTSLASIAGPFVSSAVLPLGIRVVMAMQLGLMGVVTLLFVLTWRRIGPDQTASAQEAVSESDEEQDALTSSEALEQVQRPSTETTPLI